MPSPAERPRVVVLATTFPGRAGDGTPEFVLTLCRALPDFEVTVVAPLVRGSARHEDIDGVHVRRVRYVPGGMAGVADDAILPALRERPARALQIPALVLALAWGTWRELRRTRASILNAHWIFPAGLIAAVLHRCGGPPYVVTVHGADAYTLRAAPLRALKRAVLRGAAAVAPVSEDIAVTLGLRSDSPVLRMGVDTDAVRAAVGRRRPEPGRLLYVGRLADKKGVDVLLEALVSVPGAHLVVIGDGPDRSALERRVEGLGLGGRAELRGRQPKEQVFEALATAMAVVIPSRVGAGGDQEGTPVVLAEAMAAGVPVVASALGGLGEGIEHGRTGLLVPPGDVAALADALRSVVAFEVDLEGMATAARAEAATSLDIGAVGRAYQRLFLEAAR